MSYLSFIEDKELVSCVNYVLTGGLEAIENSQKKFYKNVIDPFASLFEAGVFDMSHDHWVKSETFRQCQKTLQNRVGHFHQKILGSVSGFENLGEGEIIDLVNHDKKVIAEVKNKYNTVTGSKLSGQYSTLENLVNRKASKYKGYTAYFVNIIPKKPSRYNDLFTPSDPDKGAKCAENEKIRIIDGASFYSMATGVDTSLNDLHDVLPEVIEHVLQENFDKKDFKIEDKEEFVKYFSKAFK